MAVKPVSDWSSSYEDLFYKDLKAEKTPMLWGDWVHKNTQGIAAAPPYAASTPTLNRASFPPVSSPPAPSCVPFCTLLSNAWFAYIASTLWTVIPPIPPFSAIAFIGPSMTGIAAAKTTLLSTLIGIMSAPANANAGKMLAQQIAAAFYAATLSTGIMISGTSLPSPTPVPLVLPMMPIL
jgi:hypothetical protein